MTANSTAIAAFRRNIISRAPRLPTKIPDVTTPAIVIEAMAPLPNGQIYSGSLAGNTIHFPVVAIHKGRQHDKPCERSPAPLSRSEVQEGYCQIGVTEKSENLRIGRSS